MGRDDQLVEAERMEHSEGRTCGQRLGQLELLSMAAGGEEGTERRGEEWVEGMDRVVLGEVILALAAHRDVQAGRELHGGAGRRGGHLMLPTGEEEDDTGSWACAR